LGAAGPLPEEKVWDYPRPPRLERIGYPLRIEFAGEVIAETTKAHRILETSHPPTYYIPQSDIRMDLLVPAGGGSFCEFKGKAKYFSIEAGGRTAERAAWCYMDPSHAYVDIAEDLSFYASSVDACFVNGVQVNAQEGDFYGGWITPNLIGPFKGGLGTWGW